MKKLLTFVLALLGIYSWAAPKWDLSAVSANKVKFSELKLKNGKNPIKVRAASFLLAMSDKTGIFTMVAAPVGVNESDKYPTVFIRTPYAQANAAKLAMFCQSQAAWLSKGYAVVFQHCRGTGASEGEFYPYTNERADGLEALQMIRKLPFYNGEIFLTGQSYLATVHYAYLDAAPEDVKGAVLLVQGIDRYNFRFRNNMLRASSAGWHFINFRKNSKIKKNYSESAFRTLPLADMTQKVFGESVPSIDNMLKSADPAAEYWQTPDGGSTFQKALSNFKFPILFVGGLYDIYTGENFNMWRKLTPQQRQISAMIMTPYDHSPSTRFRAGHHPVNFENGSLDKVWKDFRYDFFEYCRNREKKLEFITPGNITYYSLWENKWCTEPDLPDGSEKLTFYLGSRTLQKSSATGSISYVYDPLAPAQFPGGCNYRFGGMALQKEPDFRKDVVSFVSDAFDKTVRVRGKMSAKIYVKSDCEDTSFFLRLSIVKGDKTYCLRDDIMPVSKQYPNYKPNTVVPLDFSFIEHAFVLEKGDKLRLDISSACWPTFLPHTNYKGDQYKQATVKQANNTIIFDNSTVTITALP